MVQDAWTVGILVTGTLQEKYERQFGAYDCIFKDFFLGGDSRLSFRSYLVNESELPTSPSECDCWLVTGSAHSAFEDLEWIERLSTFIRQTVAHNVPIFGICFGHQIMAQALGGKVEREPNRRWGLGVHSYNLDKNAAENVPGFSDLPDQISLQASHQDQVTQLPEGATCIGGNDFCPYGVISYTKSAASMQLHPELEADFVKQLIVDRTGQQLTPEQAELALEHVYDPVDADKVVNWMIRFLRQ